MMKTLLNEKLLSIWKNAAAAETKSRLPLFFTQLKSDCLLFVGLNPSFSDKGFKKVLTGKHQGINHHEFYKFPTEREVDYDQHAQIEKQSFEQHPYFAKFREISKKTGVDWEHIDLFAVRETNQAELKGHIVDQHENLTPFGRRQLELSKQAIQSSRPKVIVVANAFASRIFQKEFNATFDDRYGYHTVQMTLGKAPVFLTSMLTGQRALDNFSYERLQWQIGQAIKTRAQEG